MEVPVLTQKVPAVCAQIERVVAPVLQTYPPVVVADEVSVIPVPGQILVDPLALIVGEGGVELVETTTAAEVALQDPCVTVTL